MKVYLIKIYNGSDVLVYSDRIQASNENDAIIKALENAIIYDGDTLTIEEI